ncbi:activated RNA polymerase II transcriptionalcoactivator p15 [Striga asiatica]|uniref:Activated RNA polymerase II transcriptionalcoactivator p15 n=1 Tax=Striga asiatica TaxID=4170 RepID=A0A5A7QXM0_STRAF|nr:activated RNA polymerase II transcriptionalcoactivator p15 [Striga asiatica]
MDGEGLDASKRRKIENTVMEILGASDLESTTECTVRAAVEQRLGLSLSAFSHRRLVQRLIDSFLLSTAAAALNNPSPRGNSPRTYNVENGDYNGKVICKLSDKRMVTVYDQYGKTMVAIRDFDLIHGNMRPSKGHNSGLSLEPAQWSSLRNSFPSIQTAIVELESRLRHKSDVNLASNLNYRSEAIAKQSEADTTNSVADSGTSKSQTEADISNSTSIFNHPIKTEQAENESQTINPTADSKAEKNQTQGDISDSASRNHVAAEKSRESNQSSHENTPCEMNQTEAHIPNSVFHSPNQAPIHDTDSLVLPEQSNPDNRNLIEVDPLKKPHSTSNTVRCQQLVPIQPVRLDGRNYNSWRTQMEFLLKQLKIAYVLDETLDEKGKVIADIQKWTDDDYICRLNILNSLSDNLFQLYTPKNLSARALWEELKSAYDEDFGTKRSRINNYIQFQMVEGVPVSEQARELGKIADSIIASGIWIDEYFHVSMIVSKLPPSWREFRARLMHEDFLPLNVLMRRLQVEEESRKREFFNFRKDNVEPKSDSRLGVRKRGSDKRVCYSCGKEGHVSTYCRERKFEGREKGGEKENEDACVENTKQIDGSCVL